MESATARPLLPRGVWIAEYLIDSHPALCAVDSMGNCIRRVKLSPGVDESAAREWLEGLLEHYDPAPAPLRLLPRDTRRVPVGVFILMNRPHALRR